MGSSLSAARQLAQRLPQAPSRKLKPFSPGEIDALNRIAAQDQARMKDLPSIEELNAKDVSLDQFLNKLGGAIEGRDLSPDAAPQTQDATGGRTEQRMPPARPPQALLRSEAKVRRSAPSADDQPGRLHSYVLREILEGRTAAAAEGRQLDLEPYVRTHKADAAKLRVLMEHCCLPTVGKVATFGHQYAFARAPLWWLKEGVSGAQYLSEPEEMRKRLMGNPVAPGGSGGGMFRGAGQGAEAGQGAGAGTGEGAGVGKGGGGGGSAAGAA